MKTKLLSASLNCDILPQKLKNTIWANNIERAQYAKILKPYLKTIPNKQRIDIYRQILSSFSDVELPRGLMMDWTEIKKVKNEDCAVGSHTISHPLLTKMDNLEDIRIELKMSREKIKKELDTYPVTISYPFGSYDHRVKEIAKNIGYKFGLAVNHRTYNSTTVDFFEIPRIEIYSESMFKTKLRINETIQKTKRIFHR